MSQATQDVTDTNPFDNAPGQSKWIVEAGPADTCSNAMAVIAVVGQAILDLPGSASEIDEERAEGLFRMLMCARDAIETVHSHLDRIATTEAAS